MIQPISMTHAEARQVILQAQGLMQAAPFGKGYPAVARAIDHLGYVQLDTISVVERAHHHVLWSRIPGYTAKWLTDAQVSGRHVFEYWAHAAAYLPLRHYRFSLPVMQNFRDQKDRWPKSSLTEMQHVLHRIRDEGPLMSRDFTSDHTGGTWWDWKPAKWALQRLFFEGQLMVSHREGFQRVYDLPERILPSDVSVIPPATKEYYAHHILTTLTAQGLAGRKDLVHLRKIDHPLFDQVLNQLVHDGRLLTVQLDQGKTYFMISERPDHRKRFTSSIRILSPFDNLVIWRNRLRDIFGFDYTLECYLPAHKRRYGYFCLPLLYRDQFIGRMDSKADRTTGTLHIHRIHWERGFEDMADDVLFEKALASFAAFNQCDEVAIRKARKRR